VTELSALAEAFDPDQARRVLARLLAEGLPPDQVAGAALDAGRIAQHVLGYDPRLASPTKVVTPGQQCRLADLARRRLGGEPVARLTGEREFWSLALALSPETLVPRPDTETVVEAALRHLAARKLTKGVRILDLGTGSGAILLALLTELPTASGVGVDVSTGAAATARRNSLALGLADRASFVVGHWAEAIAGVFDIVVSNPPYIRTGEIAGLSVEVRDHDPRLALDGGADGLSAHRQVVTAVGRLLADGGAGFIEIGAGQAGEVGGLATATGLAWQGHRDLAGQIRVIEVGRP